MNLEVFAHRGVGKNKDIDMTDRGCHCLQVLIACVCALARVFFYGFFFSIFQGVNGVFESREWGHYQISV